MNYQNWEPVSNPKSKTNAPLKYVNWAGCPGGPLPGAAVCRIYSSILQESLEHRVALVPLLSHLRPSVTAPPPSQVQPRSQQGPHNLPLPPCNVSHGSFQILVAFWPLNLLSIDCMGFITFYWLLMLLVLWINANSSIIYTICGSSKAKKHSFSPFYRFCSFPSGEHHDPHEIRKMNMSNYFDLQTGWQCSLGFPLTPLLDGNSRKIGAFKEMSQEVGCCPQERGIRQGWDSPESPSKPPAL